MAKFNGFGGMGGMNMQQMMKQAKAMQEELAKAQAALEEAEVEGKSGGGMVTVKMNGKKRLLGVTIDPAAIDPDDAEMLEDLILAAYNDALDKAEELEQKTVPYGGMLG